MSGTHLADHSAESLAAESLAVGSLAAEGLATSWHIEVFHREMTMRVLPAPYSFTSE